MEPSFSLSLARFCLYNKHLRFDSFPFSIIFDLLLLQKYIYIYGDDPSVCTLDYWDSLVEYSSWLSELNNERDDGIESRQRYSIWILFLTNGQMMYYIEQINDVTRLFATDMYFLIIRNYVKRKPLKISFIID